MFDKMSGTTTDLTESNIEKLKQLFPEIIVDGKIDFEKLQLVLGKEIDDTPDRYNFTWHGKKKTMQFAQQPSKGTLRPIKEKSKDCDTTGNIYIEGDNLEVLKLLQKSYNNKVKMIYIDPPYNTGNDFVYKDNFKNNVDSYLELTGQKDNEGTRFSSNTESNGRYHTDWLNMMYPRLKLARNLIKQDGFIAVSISDEEYHNLRKIMDEIFGEKNFRNDILVRRYDKNINNQFAEKGLKSLNVGSEHILIYAASDIALFNAIYRKSSDERSIKGYWKGFWNDADRPTMRYDILGFTPEKGQWKWKKENAEEAISNYKNYKNQYADKYSIEEYWELTGKEKKFIRRREGLSGKNNGVEHWVAPSEGILRSSNWNDLLISESISKFNLKFDSPKNKKVIKELLSMMIDKDSIILDFFSGSATTAHATMELNAEDGGNRKFIMVQLPEILDEKSQAYKDGYRTICDIGEERIRRAGDKLKNELIEKNNKEGMLLDSQINPDEIDIGFKVFSLDSSNLNEWQADFDNIESNIDLFGNNFVDGRSEEDVLYEIIIKNGLDLTYPINEVIIEEFKIYDVAFGNLFVCLNDKITRNVAHRIVSLRQGYGIETSQVVFKDNGFENDTEKLNCYEILKDAGYQDSDLLSI